jgi:hypothetical protein
MPLDAEKRAPDAEIAEAIADLDARVMEATVLGDASAPILAAAVAGIRAQRSLRDETKADLNKAVTEIGRMIQEQPAAKSPLSADEFRRAIVQSGQVWGPAAVRVLGWRNLLVGVGIAVALYGAGWGTGYWWRGYVPTVAGISAGKENCETKADGSRLCWIPVWEIAPTPARH